MKIRIRLFLQTCTRQLFRTAVLLSIIYQAGYMSANLIFICFLIGFLSEIDNLVKDSK